MRHDSRFVRLPPHRPGMRIGLYGGSFDPPHAGHRHVAVTAQRRLALDRVWWIVGPGNPLKDRGRLPGVGTRAEATRAVVSRHPRMVVTDFEGALGAHYTVETIRFVLRRCPGTDFVWIMGADSFATFHRWRAWREIARLVPLAVVDRPGWTLRALNGPAARAFAVRRRSADGFAGAAPPAWTFLFGPRSSLSSTKLRARQADSTRRC